MTWLAQLSATTPYVTGVALPMVLIGIGQGLAFAPLTVAGLARVTGTEAGAASGLVNTTHQLGSTLGVAVLVALSAGAGTTLTDRVGTAYTGGAVMLAAALVAVVVLILPPEIAARAPSRPADEAPGTSPVSYEGTRASEGASRRPDAFSSLRSPLSTTSRPSSSSCSPS